MKMGEVVEKSLEELRDEAVAASVERLKDEGEFLYHACSMCGYWCKYIYVDGEVSYDSGCHCTRYSAVRATTMEDFGAAIRMQSNEELLEHLADGGDMLEWRRGR